jgi:hypothetical protein
METPAAATTVIKYKPNFVLFKGKVVLFENLVTYPAKMLHSTSLKMRSESVNLFSFKEIVG